MLCPVFRSTIFQHILGLLLLLPTLSLAVKPVFDYSNNMRLVMLPSDTKLGSVIYRLRASDADEDYPLKFTAYDTGQGPNSGQISDLIGITHVDCSTMAICEADVILTKSIDEKTSYTLSLEVQDTKGETTIVESVLQATAPKGPFIGAPRILKVPESTQPGQLIHSFHIRENMQVYRGVHCHLEPAEAELYFDLDPGVKTNVKDISKCDLKLMKKLDYESRSAFILQIVAENAWVDGQVDTRNVGSHEVVIEVQDIPDTPPYFLIAPPVTKLPETATIGNKVLQVIAYDGDYAHPRRIRYGLDPTGLAFSNYFDIDPDEGIVKVRKSLQDIDIQPSTPLLLRIIAEELDDNGLTTGEATNADIAIIIDDVLNHPPQFLQKSYIASIEENAAEGTTLQFVAGFDKVQDFDKGDNGKLELSLVGFTDTFEVSPSIVNQEGQFVISVKNNKRLDFEQVRQLNFQIQATELGVSKLTAVADVSVNILDVNDNRPEFSDSSELEINVPENQLAGVQIGRVIAFDADSKENGEIQYQKINTGNSELMDSIEIDINSGNLILVDNKGLDREVLDRFALNIEAVDKGQPPLRSQATVIINILDINDNAPIFKRRKYQGFMNQELTDLRNDLQVEAFDLDQAGTKNSEIRYEIIHGNYEKKFFIDSISGQISVMEPLTPGLIRHGRDAKEPVSVTKVQRVSQANIEPVISLTVRAYDLGIPSLDSEVLVHIFTEQTSSRSMRFIVYQDPDDLDKNDVSDLISAMTGGQAEIQDIQPYSQGYSIDRMDYLEVDYVDTNDRNDRNAKEYQDEQPTRSRRSLVDVLITYPTNTSVVDMNDITSKLVKEVLPVSSTVGPGQTTPDPDMMQELQYKNAALFWGLIAILVLIFLFILLMTICFCCPGCYFYKSKLGMKSNTRPESGSSTTSGIKVLKVRNGDGQELKDARFVELLKSGKSNEHDPKSSQLTKKKIKEHSRGFKNNKVKVYEPTYRDTNNIIFIRDELESGSSSDSNSNAPIFVRALEQHSPGKLRQKQFVPQNPDEKIFKVIDETKRSSPSRNAKDDVQIMKLDDDARITETYQKIGNAEVLAIEDNPIAEEITSTNIEYQDVATSPRQSEPAQRTMSELELFRQKHNLPEDGEFYTAIGPDGKEIILRRYLNDQSPDLNASQNKPGFLNVAMNHLKENNKNRHKRTSSLDGEDSIRSTSEDEGGPNTNLRPFFDSRLSGPPSVISAPDVLYNHPPVPLDTDRSPKHYIRTPILEETEEELRQRSSRRGVGMDKSYYRFWNEDPDVSLRFKIQDAAGRSSPVEPAYVDTKASILRRRNTMAKMMQQEFGSGLMKKLKERHWSLTDLPQQADLQHDFTVKRWNSLSHDEMVRLRDHHHLFVEPNMRQLPKGSTGSTSNMVQMANITVMPSHEPRKFSKYNPSMLKRRRPTEELIYIRQNFPSERNMRTTTVWNRHGAPPPRNIEIQHTSTNPTIAHYNSFGANQVTLDVYSNTSSEFPSRTSSVSNLRQSDKEQGPYLTNERSSPKRQSQQIAPRYMNWYTKSKSTMSQPTTLDAKQLRKKEIRSSLPEVNLPSPKEEDAESGISSLSQAGGKNNTLLQKKSIFTIAYDDMATSNIQPISTGNSEDKDLK